MTTIKDMMIETEFMKLYEELLSINEDTLLNEAGDFGGYKKAFLNFAKGLYYVRFEAEDGQRVKPEGKEISSTDIAPETTKQSQAGTAKELGDKIIGPNSNIEVEFKDNVPTQRELTSRELVAKSNRKLGAKQRIQYTKKQQNAETGEVENVYTIYDTYASVLHHMDTDHGHNAKLRDYTYKPTNGDPSKTKVFSLTDDGLYNYVLVSANTQKQASYGHMLIHVLILIVAALKETKENEPIISLITGALDRQLIANNGEATVFTIFDPNASDIIKTKKLNSISALYAEIKSNPN